jgi:hypothetical protein
MDGYEYKFKKKKVLSSSNFVNIYRLFKYVTFLRQKVYNILQSSVLSVSQ